MSKSILTLTCGWQGLKSRLIPSPPHVLGEKNLREVKQKEVGQNCVEAI